MINPFLLWFLPLALLPVLLHLIARRRLKTIELSTFRFLMEGYVHERRRTRLLEFLVLLLRLGFVALVVLMLARPVVKRFAFLGGAGGRDVAIVIDASSSMALMSGGTTSLDRAKSAAGTVIRLLGPEDYVKVIRVGQHPTVLAEGFAKRPGEIAARLDTFSTDAGGADLAAALREVFSGKSHGPRVIYLFSDGLRRTWSAVAGHPVLEKLTGRAQVVVMNVGPTDTVVNAAVTGDAPLAARAVKGLPVLLRASVVNRSPERTLETTLSVFLDDEQVDRVHLTLQPGQRASCPVSVIPARGGAIRGRFQLPSDAFPDDDAFLFCLNVEEKLDVVLVTGAADGPGTRRPDLYLRAALTSPERAFPALGADARRLAAAIAVTAVQHDAVTDAVLNAADVVVLADAPVDAKCAAMLRGYVEAGGGMLVLPGANTDSGALAAGLFKGAAVRLGEPTGDVEDESHFLVPGDVNVAHPVLSAFRDDEVDYFSTVRVRRHFPVLPTAAAAAAAEAVDEAAGDDATSGSGARTSGNVLVRLSDETPVLVEAALGDGKLLVAGFPATPDWSNLPVKPEFVPLLLRAVSFLRKPADATAPAAVAPGEPAPLTVTSRWPLAHAQLIDPAGKRHPIDLVPGGAGQVGAMLRTDRKGHYTFEILPNAEGVAEKIELGFAVNLADDQGDFEMTDEADIREMLRDSEKLVYLRSSTKDPILAEQLTHKSEIWRTLIWATFLVIGAEFLIATFRPRRAPTKTDGPSSDPKRGAAPNSTDKPAARRIGVAT